MSYSPLYCISCGTANQPQAAFCFSCGHALQSSAGVATATAPTGSLTLNHLLNQRYQIISQLGKGGFGAVYKAEDTQLGKRVVAVKEMSQRSLQPHEIAEAVDAFKREALMLGSLTHQNLPRIYDHFSDGGRWYLVMDFIAGQTLEEHLNSAGAGQTHRLPLEQVLDIGVQLCTVLGYLHSRQPPIIFRDLKPANVILDPDGHLYLIDFGIARHFKPGQSKDTIAFGSPGYAAPEQYGKAQTNPRADIYSLGATLHQVLTGNDPSQAPFRFQPPRSYDPSIPAALDALVMQMLDMDEGKRPASMAVIKQELQRIITLRASGQLDPFPSSLAATRAAYLPTLSPFIGNTVTTYRDHAGHVKAVAWSPDGTRIVSADNTKVQVWEVGAGHTLHTYRGHSSTVNAVAWSPDGQRIASASDDKTVQVWLVTHVGNIISGAYVCDYNGHSNWVNSLAWSPDGRRIASASADETVQVWNAINGRTIFTYSGHHHRVWSVVWSPDGKYIASGSTDQTAQVWNPVDGYTIFTYRARDGINAVAWNPVWGTGYLSPGEDALPGGQVMPESKRIALGNIDHTVQVLEPFTGQEVLTYRGHSGWVWSVAWSPDGRYIASASDDKTVQIWEAATGQTVFTYRGHSARVNAVAWSPDGASIASGSADQTVQVWKVR
jgi:eukaryotic-like serine/threonine-protein kinase